MVRSLTLIAMLLLAGSAWAPADVRIGYVDMKRLLDLAPQVMAGRAELDVEFRPRNQQLLDDEQRLVEMEQALAAQSGLNSEQALEREREIRSLRRSVERRREDLAEELNFRRNEEIRNLGEEIELAVKTVAEREGYDLVLSSPVAFASAKIDITDQVLDFLEVDYELRSRRGRQ